MHRKNTSTMQLVQATRKILVQARSKITPFERIKKKNGISFMIPMFSIR